MHDPSTVAFDIKYPWRAKPCKFWPEGYRSTFITIWHEDPERGGDNGCRDDDSCGWFRPPLYRPEREQMQKLGRSEYSTIWSKQAALADGKDYFYICVDQDCYGAIYWAWRRIKQTVKPRGAWNFGGVRNFLTASELEEIYSLAWNPIDNLQRRYAEVTDAEKAAEFFVLIYRCFARHHRPWWKHPRWHVHHWRFQVHPWQAFKRWAFARCAGCSKGFRWGESVWGYGDARIFHNECSEHGPKTRGVAAMPSQPIG